jgi:BirA family biotin operon repressor/biotin-[acetyl-CoA-carboxylase] ligase
VVSEPGLIWLSACGSTNDEAMSRIDDLSVRAVGADAQTAGRGRRGRTWASPPGSGLYLSWIARPTFSARLGAVLPLMGAVAVAEVCEDLGLRPTVKWPNDLLVEGRKLAGVLCEARGTATHWHAVVGIGLNLRTPADGWPAGVAAVALDTHLDLVPSARGLAPKLLKRLDHWLERVGREADPRSLLQAWELWAPPRGTWMRRGSVEGRYAGIAPDGALRLDVGDTELLVHAGDVELVDRED